ncbi:hypothetical protein PCANC_13318 [Puccinia coronata f. sp. avenae]|uniref:Calcofluor white hypersensitive protein n=1 Tax=Puccinia coronata f. sp. avenae TaxID=200324 RepID=A0A2N5SZH4_9BASI|nr:hypothetical protein PCANC_13318 [Puccinia coronata f. sp. avenae]PLW48194.1 hypothetical protein PCASD_03336 [Puccinia coronata f. sp. avenae]
MRQGGTILTVNGSQVALVHTLFALGAFGGALLIGCYLHYKRIVKNEWYGYPQEWFPSVSATIGDFYPERPIFQILIAFNSGPRLLLVYLTYAFQTHFSTKASTTTSKFVALCGFLRTISCGGWVYVTSSDDHFWHDVMMIAYIVLTIPWQLGNVVLSPNTVLQNGNKYRRRFSALFFLSTIPLVYFFLQHKVKRVPGAYTYYAFIEWSLILYDVLYDSSTILDFAHFDFVVVASPKSKADVARNLVGGPGLPGLSRSNPPEKLRKIVSRPSGNKVSKESRTRDTMQFIAQVYFGFVFWTTLTAVGPVIFYFSVWSMGLDGQEVLLFATVAPFLLCSSLFRSFFRTALPILQFFSLLSIGSYLVDRELFYDDAVLRLQLTTIAVGLCTTLQTFKLFQSKLHSRLELEKCTMALGIGLVASVVLKYANYSLNPMWPIMRKNNGGFHRIGLILGILSSLCLPSDFAKDSPPDVEDSPVSSPVSKHSSRSSSPVCSSPSERSSDSAPETNLNSHGPAWWRAVLGFGGIIFIVHTLFTDSGTMIAWVWDGYPVTGPLPLEQGYWMILAMCIGLFLPLISDDDMLHHLRWLLVGCTSAFGLYSFHGWLGFACGLLLCIFCLSIFPRYLEDLVTSSQSGGWWKLAAGFGFGYLIYDVMELFHTFTVAYAFVPLAAAFRERTDAILLVTMTLISLGFFQPRPSDQPSQSFQHPKRTHSVKVAKILLGVLAFTSVMVMLKRTAFRADIQPYHPENRTFKAGIWTVHFAVDSGMWETQRRIKDIVEELELDVIGLLETDLQRIVMGNRDITQYISEELGMYVDIGPGPNKHTWGAVLLSKFPIINSTHHLLPSPHGELAPAIHATLDIWGTHVDVIVSHNGQEEDPIDRTLQSTKLAQIMRTAYPKPFVFLGYVVSQPHARRPAPYEILVEDGRMLDIEPSDTDRWCEYILFRGLKRLGYARVTRGSSPAVTDTELQVGMFQVPPGWVMVDPDRDSSGYERVSPDFIAPASRFSAKVGSDEGFKGHRYHVLREQFGTDVVYYRM